MRNAEVEEKKKLTRKYENFEKKASVENCVCDFEINCKYCEDHPRDKHNLYSDTINTLRDIDEQKFAEEELQAIRNLKQKIKKEKIKRLENLRDDFPLFPSENFLCMRSSGKIKEFKEFKQ